MLNNSSSRKGLVLTNYIFKHSVSKEGHSLGEVLGMGTSVRKLEGYCVCAQLLWSCLTLGDPMDCSVLRSSYHGIL